VKCYRRTLSSHDRDLCSEIGHQAVSIFKHENREGSFFLNNLLLPKRPLLKRCLINKELEILLPYPTAMKSLLQLYKDANVLYGAGCELKIQDYVSSTRANFIVVDKISCDWCGLVNGVLQYCEDLIKCSIKK
jgi:hypothetical protein